MIKDVLVYRITNTYSGSWPASTGSLTLVVDNYLHIRLDDATLSIIVDYRSASPEDGGTFYGTLLNGPARFAFDNPGNMLLLTPLPYYQYCDGTTLRQIRTDNLFPYGGVTSYPGAAECMIAPTCDLELSSNYTTVEATGPVTPDGEIHVTATSSNGAIRYGLNDFVYATGGQATGDFLTLVPGNYTVYVKDALGCTDTLSVEVKITTLYGVRHRLVFQDKLLESSKFHRVDILERAYEGEILEMCGGDAPIKIVYRGDRDDPSKPYIPAQAELSILVEESGQYEHLSTPDDRKYKLEHFYGDDETTPNLYFTGYGIPQLNLEPYLAPPYYFTISFTDGLEDMIQKPFKDYDGNQIKGDQSLIKVLAECLKKTDLHLPIRVSVNVFEAGMGAGVVIPTYRGIVLWTQDNTGTDANNWNYNGIHPYLTVLGASVGQYSDFYYSTTPLPDEMNPIQEGVTYKYHLFLTSTVIQAYDVEFVMWDSVRNILISDIQTFVNGSDDHVFTLLAPTGALRFAFRIKWTNGAGPGQITFEDLVEETVPAQDADTFSSVFIDTRLFKDVSCETLIIQAMLPWRAQIFQSMGYWWIIRLSDAVGVDMPYREFDEFGDPTDNDTFHPIRNIGRPTLVLSNKLMFANRSQILSRFQNYGTFNLINDLALDSNLIDEGAFEPEDVITLGSGNSGFQNWNVNLGQGGIEQGLEAVDNGNSTGAWYFDFTNAVGLQNDTTVYSKVIKLDGNGLIKLRFQYNLSARYNVPYLRLAWGLKIDGDDGPRWLTYASNGSIDYDDQESKNNIYVSTFDTWQTFEVTNKLPDFIDIQSVQVFFWFHNHYGRDFQVFEEFKDYPLSLLSNPGGQKRMVSDPSDRTYVYTSEAMYDATNNEPSLVLPNDYDGSGNFIWVWKLDKTLNLGPNVNLTTRVRLDNVSVAFYPQLPLTAEFVEPQKTLNYSETVSLLVKSDYNRTLLLGDMIRYDETHYRNEPNLYRGYFRIPTGTPTRHWARKGVTEDKLLLTILLEDLISQFSEPQYRLSSDFMSTGVFHFINAVNLLDDNSRYRPITMDFNVVKAIYTMDLARVLTGESGEPPVIIGEFDPLEFSEEFNIGTT